MLTNTHTNVCTTAVVYCTLGDVCGSFKFDFWEQNNTDIIIVNYSSLFLKKNILKRSYGLRTELKVEIKTEINF